MKVIIKTLLTLVIVLQALPATAADSSKTRKLFAVGSVGDDIAKFFGKIHWDILFTEGFEACMDDEGCRAFAPIFITLIITMICVSGYWCYINDRRVTAQEEHNSS